MLLQNYSCQRKLTSAVLSFCLLSSAVCGFPGVLPLAHAQTKPTFSAEQETALKEADKLSQQAEQLYHQGKFNQAIPLAEQALAIRKRVLGDHHFVVATSLNDLGILYTSQGRYAEAEPLYKQALEIRKQLLGEHHPAVADSLNDLADLYHYEGRYAEAEPLYKQALELRKQLLGERHPTVAASLNNLALLYTRQGRYAEAESLYKQALELNKQLLGEYHPEVATNFTNLASLYQDEGRYAEAEPLYKQALELRKQLLGEHHPDVANSLNNLADLYQDEGRYAEAEPLYKQALELRKQLLGEHHPDVANSLTNLASLYHDEDRYAEAEPLYKQALELRKQLLGEHHPDVADSLNNLAELYLGQGRYGEAEPLFKQALELRKQLLGEHHPDVATSLNNLAELYRRQGRYVEAEPLFKQALELNKQLLGKHHSAVANSLNNLAELYHDEGRYAEAEPLFKQALELRKQLLGEHHSAVANSLNNLASLYHDEGRYAEAEPLYKQALELRKQLLGEHHPDVATSLNNLADLYQDEGRYSEAEPLFKQALELRKQLLGEHHPEVADSLNNLAELYRRQGRYVEAEPLFKQALELRKQLLGEHHPTVATGLNNLADLYQNQGRYAEAEPLYKQALELRKQLLGEHHPAVATSLNNLAFLYQNEGRYAEAEPLFKQALELDKQLLGEHHPDVAHSFNNLATLYQVQGQSSKAITALTQGMEIQERNLGINLAIGAEAQKQAYLTTLSGTTNSAISLHLQSAPNNPDAAKLALTTLLRRKGRILDTLADNLNRLRQNLTPSDQGLLDQLTTTRTQLANLYYSGLGKLSPEQYRNRIAQLEQQATQLEADLNNRSTEFQRETQPVTLEAIQNQIPANAALVELIRYYPFNSKAKLSEPWGKPHYAVYLLTAQGNIQAVDLGEAVPIDQLAAKFRYFLQHPNLDPKPVARQLDALLMQPIRQKLGNTHQLLISPDSQLNLIPFAALVDEQNRYLVETYAISYLTSGRDLLRLQTHLPSRQPAVLVANPDYADPGDPNSVARVQSSAAPTLISSKALPNLNSRGENQRSIDLSQLQFGPLPGTAAEAAAIAPKFPGAIVLTGTQATENALKQVQAPRILHIATHGFFLEDVALPAPANSNRGLAIVPAPGAEPQADFGLPRPRKLGNTENALLRSGLVLAGFNPRKSGNEDGVLTALEAAGLDLRGTQLVVLSACETGLGDIANGEGVYGLRRAFTLAGAETQLISLWQVNDDSTKELMVRYYDKLLKGVGRSDALLQTQREFLQDAKYRHPYYWAAFIPSGDGSPLRPK